MKAVQEWYIALKSSLFASSKESDITVEHQLLPSDEKDLNGSLHDGDKPQRRSNTILQRVIVVSVKHCLVAAIAIVLFSMWRTSDDACMRQLSIWSPFFDVVKYETSKQLSYIEKQSPYRGHPTPELEKAWSDLTGAEVEITLPFDKMDAIGKAGMGHLYKPSLDGKGYEAVPAVSHDLHCLNYVRQYLHLVNGSYAPVGVADGRAHIPTFMRFPDIVIRGHVEHCLEQLRQSLMCTSDVTPLLSQLHDGPGGGRADFQNLKKCRRFDLIWQKIHPFKPDEPEEDRAKLYYGGDFE